MPNYWETKNTLIFHLRQMENLLVLGVPILKNFSVFNVSLFAQAIMDHNKDVY